MIHVTFQCNSGLLVHVSACNISDVCKGSWDFVVRCIIADKLWNIFPWPCYFLSFLCSFFLLLSVAMTWYSYSYHYSLLPLLVVLCFSLFGILKLCSVQFHRNLLKNNHKDVFKIPNRYI